jgi:hypothetical protein
MTNRECPRLRRAGSDAQEVMASTWGNGRPFFSPTTVSEILVLIGTEPTHVFSLYCELERGEVCPNKDQFFVLWTKAVGGISRDTSASRSASKLFPEYLSLAHLGYCHLVG